MATATKNPAPPEDPQADWGLDWHEIDGQAAALRYEATYDAPRTGPLAGLHEWRDARRMRRGLRRGTAATATQGGRSRILLAAALVSLLAVVVAGAALATGGKSVATSRIDAAPAASATAKAKTTVASVATEAKHNAEVRLAAKKAAAHRRALALRHKRALALRKRRAAALRARRHAHKSTPAPAAKPVVKAPVSTPAPRAPVAAPRPQPVYHAPAPAPRPAPKSQPKGQSFDQGG